MKCLVFAFLWIPCGFAATSNSPLNLDFPEHAASIRFERTSTDEAIAEAYPQDAHGFLQLAGFRSFNLGEQLSSACEKVPDRLRLYQSTFTSETSKRNIRDALLNLNQIRVAIEAFPWVRTWELEQRLSLPALFIRVWNPLEMSEIRLAMEVDKTAQSLQLESSAALETRILKLLPWSLLAEGRGSISFTSVPLACDLAAGRIRLVLHYQGQYKNPAVYPVPVTEGEPSNDEPSSPLLLNQKDSSTPESRSEVQPETLPYQGFMPLRWQ